MTTPPNELETGEDENDVSVTAHSSAPGRSVFIEEGNADGWIATDTTVDLER